MSDTADMSDPKVEWLTVAGDVDTWRSLGLTVTTEGLIPLVGASIRIVAATADHETGIVGWALSGVEDVAEIDGLVTEVVAPMPPIYAQHALRSVGPRPRGRLDRRPRAHQRGDRAGDEL